MEKYQKYLGIKHDYAHTNCITLIANIYEHELHRDAFFTKLWEYIDIKEGRPEQKSRWWKFLQYKNLLKYAKEYAIKVESITDLQEYDIIIFKSRSNIPIHFGMYIGQNMMIHIQEKEYSKIEMLNDNWRGKIHSVYRSKMV